MVPTTWLTQYTVQTLCVVYKTRVRQLKSEAFRVSFQSRRSILFVVHAPAI